MKPRVSASETPGSIYSAAAPRWGSWRLKPALGWIGAEKQIAERPAQQVGDPPLRQMVRTIVDYVAALAQALEIT